MPVWLVLIGTASECLVWRLLSPLLFVCSLLSPEHRFGVENCILPRAILSTTSGGTHNAALVYVMFYLKKKDPILDLFLIPMEF